MPTIRAITEAEFQAWLAEAVPGYAADKVASGAWDEASALERARNEHLELLPQGKDTPDHYLYSIVDDGGAQVGTLWFASREMGPNRVAYVYDIEIKPAHRRRGHARRAFEALESEARRLGLAAIALHVFGHNLAAQALYAGLGFRATNINMVKSLRDDADG